MHHNQIAQCNKEKIFKSSEEKDRGIKIMLQISCQEQCKEDNEATKSK